MDRILKGILFSCIFQLVHPFDLSIKYDGVIFLYSHGLADTSRQVEKYVEAGIITAPYITFDYADSVDFEKQDGKDIFSDGFAQRSIKWAFKKGRLRFGHTALGQEYDIDQLKVQFDQIHSRWPQAKIVLIGVSRGAAAIDGLLSLYPECVPHIAAIITESEFDSMASVISNMMKLYRSIRILAKKNVQRILEFIFPKYSHIKLSPMEHLEKSITQCSRVLKIPRLIICSETDRLVPFNSTLKFYEKLCKLGHQNVHLIRLSEGRHGYLIEGKCREEYQQKVRDFLDRYELCIPHNFS